MKVLTPHEPEALLATFVFLSLPAQLAAFASGFLAFHTIRIMERRLPAATWQIALLAAVLALAWMFQSDVHNLPAISVLLGVVATCMGLGAGRYLVNRAICHIGKVSYSAYFVHFVLLNDAGRIVARYELTGAAGFAVAFAFIVPITIAVATVTYLAIERPMIVLGGKFSRSLHSAQGAG